jgi:hypothetical protein
VRFRGLVGIVAAGTISACGLGVVGEASPSLDASAPSTDSGVSSPPADATGPTTTDARVETGAPPSDSGRPVDTGAPDTGAGCPASWTAGLGHCYLVVDVATTETDAQTKCVAQGGHLVTIGSQDEQNFVAGVSGNFERWIGLTATAPTNNQASSFHWVTGEPMSFTSWASTQPNEGATCGTMLGDQYKHGWDDHTCGSSFTSICEID